MLSFRNLPGRVLGDVVNGDGMHRLCDHCDDADAVQLVQGETDSFGHEELALCASCGDKLIAETRHGWSGHCDWCKKECTDLKDARDPEEGSCGPVYWACASCRSRAARAMYEDGYEDDYDYDDDEEYYMDDSDSGDWTNEADDEDDEATKEAIAAYEREWDARCAREAAEAREADMDEYFSDHEGWIAGAAQRVLEREEADADGSTLIKWAVYRDDRRILDALETYDEL